MWSSSIRWYLVLVQLAGVACQMLDLAQIGESKDAAAEPYRERSTQCNPQEFNCSMVDPKGGITQIIGLSPEKSSNSSLDNLPLKEVIPGQQIIPSEEIVPQEEDDAQPPVKETLTIQEIRNFRSARLNPPSTETEMPSLSLSMSMLPTSSTLSPTLFSPLTLSPSPQIALSPSPRTPLLRGVDGQTMSPSPLPISLPLDVLGDEEEGNTFKPSEQQSIGKLSNSSCLMTVKNCVCEEEWMFNGMKLEGCSNPDVDEVGAWCVIKPDTCDEPAGEILVQEPVTSGGRKYDYCKPECQPSKPVVMDAAPQDPSTCVEVVNECKQHQYSVAFADGDMLQSITYRDHKYMLGQGWWNLNSEYSKVRWCSPSNSVGLFIQAFEKDQDRTSDVIWQDLYSTSRMYCVPKDGQQYSLLEFVSASDPSQNFLNDGDANFTSCAEYGGTMKRFFIYEAPQVLTINEC